MNSCIYQGRVLHRRFHPVEHAFTYRLFMLYLDLSELDHVFRGRWLWSTKFPNLAWFRRREHLGPSEQSLDSVVRQLIQQETGAEHVGPIRMLTHLRYFGMQMNPVTFFYCFDQQETLKFIVAEVNNTPWGEQHCYVLSPEHFCPTQQQARELLPKDFHVSPFMPMDMEYQWRVSAPGDRLNIGISNFQEQQRKLNVAMTMQRRPLTAASLRRVLCLYPFMTSKVFLGIYWQALRLWKKKAPFFTHPDKSSVETTSTTSSSPTQHV